MSFLSNGRSVSRERILGISLADILIQAVFLLFIALIVGYEDPERLVLLQKYEQFGKDLCDKKHPDNLTECRESFINDDRKDDYKKLWVGLCKDKYESSVDECIKKYKNDAEAMGKGHLIACIPNTNNVGAQPSVSFYIHSSDKVELIEFKKSYVDYLTENKDNARLEKVNSIKVRTIYSKAQIEPTFSFVRQPNCYHTTTIASPDALTVGEKKPIANIIYSTFNSLAKK